MNKKNEVEPIDWEAVENDNRRLLWAGVRGVPTVVWLSSKSEDFEKWLNLGADVDYVQRMLTYLGGEPEEADCVAKVIRMGMSLALKGKRVDPARPVAPVTVRLEQMIENDSVRWIANSASLWALKVVIYAMTGEDKYISKLDQLSCARPAWIRTIMDDLKIPATQEDLEDVVRLLESL